jgi:hypothetical protein
MIVELVEAPGMCSASTTKPTMFTIDSSVVLKALNVKLEPVELPVGILRPIRMTKLGEFFRVTSNLEAMYMKQQIDVDIKPLEVRVLDGGVIKMSSPDEGYIGAALKRLVTGGMIPTKRDVKGELSLVVETKWNMEKLSSDSGQTVTVRVTTSKPAAIVLRGKYKYDMSGDEITLRSQKP